MQTYTFKIFQKSDTQTDIRFLGPDERLVGRRELPSGEVERFITDVEAQYREHSPHLDVLGRKLYEWLDGPTERWLEGALRDAKGLTLRIDVSGRLRHLPWELLCRDGVFLCANPHRPFTPVRHVPGPRQNVPCDNRPLRILFMACSPTNVTTVLDFEAEERMVLEATRRNVVELLVEESGSLAGLEERVMSSDAGYFDVVHLSGHATIKEGRPCFIMEDELGRRHEATADELARAFGGRAPKLLFLSGCRTGQAVDQGMLPSLCEALVEAGMPAVLGWAHPVGDRAANLAAAKLYEALSVGGRVDEAVARTRQVLHQEQSPFWHMLRLYAAERAPLPAYVTTPQTPRRARLHQRAASVEFLDAGAKVEVCKREFFVGRRRAIQRCLRVLRSRQEVEAYAEGVLLVGMGGLGKSSLAIRLCERMPQYKRLVWVGRVDEIELLRVVSEQLADVEVNALLNEAKLGLRQRLRRLFEGPLSGQPLLFVFDDFEHNLESRSDGTHVLRPEALEALGALLAAIRDSASESRVIVTSRHAFAVPGPTKLLEESLESLRGADLEKKTALLGTLAPSSKLDPTLKERALKLSAGNPRLLERLDRVLQEGGIDQGALLDALAAKAEAFREEILLRVLLGRLSAEGKWLLSLLSVYELPVEHGAVEAVAGGTPLDPHLDRALGLGLVEGGKSLDGRVHYYVSGLTRPLLAGTLTAEETRAAESRAAKYLYEALWKSGKEPTIAWGMEIHRLALAAEEKVLGIEIGASIATSWVNLARYREAVELCRETLLLGEDYRLFHPLARAEEVLGETTAAREHYDRALEGCPTGDDTNIAQERAAIMHNLAGLTAFHGDIPLALKLWQQSLNLLDQIGDIQGKASTLSYMASIIAQQGDIPLALKLWQQSLEFQEQVGDIRGKASTIASMARFIAQQGDISRAFQLWQQSLEFQERVGDIQSKTSNLSNMANIIAQQGDIPRAIQLCQQALEFHERVGDIQGKAATLSNMANVIAEQGDVSRALQLWQQSLELQDRIGDIHGKAATLNNMASIIAEQGDVSRALQLWQQSLELKERIGDIQGKAATLNNMGLAAIQSGDIGQARTLYLEAARLLGTIPAWPDVFTVLCNLGVSATQDSVIFLAQALWLSIRVQVPAHDVLNLSDVLIEKLTPASNTSTLIAALTFFLVQARSQQHPKREELQEKALMLLVACAEANGVNDDIAGWISREGLNNPARFLPTAIQGLESLVGEQDWLFDRNLFTPATAP